MSQTRKSKKIVLEILEELLALLSTELYSIFARKRKIGKFQIK
jgi:hypothetical protein